MVYEKKSESRLVNAGSETTIGADLHSSWPPVVSGVSPDREHYSWTSQFF